MDKKSVLPNQKPADLDLHFFKGGFRILKKLCAQCAYLVAYGS